jgi:hypothetical protein
MKRIINRMAMIIRKPPVATMLAVVTAAAAMCNGGAMLIDPASFLAEQEYDLATRLVSPYVWGIVLVGLGIWLAIAVWRKKQKSDSTYSAVVALCVVYGVFAMLVGFSSLNSGTGSAPIWLYLAMASYCLITQFSLKEVNEHALEKTTSSN